MRTTTRSLSILLTAGLLATAACAHQDNSVQMGLKRVALDLSFKDQSKAKPPTVQQIVDTQQDIPAPSTLVLTEYVDQPSLPSVNPEDLQAAIPLTPKCGKALEGSVAEVPSSVFITAPPAAGKYMMHNTGTFTLQAGTLSQSGPFPPKSEMEVSNIRTETVEVTAALGPEPEQRHYFDVTIKAPGSTVTTSYMVRGSGVGDTKLPPWALASGELDVVKIVSETAGTVTEFNPTPPVAVMYFKGEGVDWRSAGIDTETNTVMTVQGTIEKRETVDVCGTMYDSYRVISNEQIINVDSGYTSRTDVQDPNVYNVATQFGGIFLSQHVNTTTTFTVQNVPVLLQRNFTSVLDSVTPVGAGAGGQAGGAKP